jgi:hypothetical protein
MHEHRLIPTISRGSGPKTTTERDERPVTLAHDLRAGTHARVLMTRGGTPATASAQLNPVGGCARAECASLPARGVRTRRGGERL